MTTETTRSAAARAAAGRAGRRPAGRGPVAGLRRPRHPAAGPAWRDVRGPARRVVRPRRRIRLRQVHDGLCRGPLPAAQRGHHRRPDPRRRRRRHQDGRRARSASSGCTTPRWSTRTRARPSTRRPRSGRRSPRPSRSSARAEAGQGERDAGRSSASRSPTRNAVAQRYPHQLSGGMQQRVVIAIALASDPKLLVLDEPTTGLDATVEASVLDLVRSLQAETNAAVLLIAHNLGVIRTLCDRVGVMYAGKIVEEGDAATVFAEPEAPVHARAPALAPAPRRPQVANARSRRSRATCRRSERTLPTCVFVDRCQLADRPVPDGRAAGRRRRQRRLERAATTSIGSASWSSRRRSSARRPSTATWRCRSTQCLEDLPPERPRRAGAGQASTSSCCDGETLGLVGESGSGKSTLAKTILGIESPDAGGNLELDEHAPRGAVVRPADGGQARPPDGLPEPGLGAQPRLDRPPHPVPVGQQADRAQGQGGQRAGRQAGRRPPPDPAPPRPQAAPAVGRAQAAAWRSPGRSPATPGSSSPTSRRARSTSRSRPRSSTCCPSCSSRAGRATC